MLILIVNTDEYRLYSDIKKQMKLKRELLGRYPESADVEIQADGKVIEKCKLKDIFEL